MVFAVVDLDDPGSDHELLLGPGRAAGSPQRDLLEQEDHDERDGRDRRGDDEDGLNGVDHVGAGSRPQRPRAAGHAVHTGATASGSDEHFAGGDPGAEVPELQGIGVMSDGDQTGSISAADYAGFVLFK